MPQALLLSVFVMAVCGLVYELLAGTLASYLLGDSVLQFSTVIGAYLFAMGIGSWLSRYIQRGLVQYFIQIEMVLGVVGGCSGALLFIAFGYGSAFRLVLYLMVSLIGILVGLEIPLILRILKDRLAFKDLISQVLALDYVGALIASVLFPLFLVPQLGLVRTSFLFGMFNVVVALAFARILAPDHRAARWLAVQGVFCIALLGAGYASAKLLTSFAEDGMYPDTIILARTTAYQRIVVTQRGGDVRLYLNGHLQFASRDEYRYHESLVHPGLATSRDPRQVLILGGGDGLAARELLKDPRVEHITLVDLDPQMTSLFAHHPFLSTLNHGSLRSPRLTVVNDDAFEWLKRNKTRFGYIVVDFPDPHDYSVGKLYTTTFYRHLADHLDDGAVFTVQSTSPLFARRSYWCIANTIRSIGLHTLPYHVYVPSFGEWGFVMAARDPIALKTDFVPGLHFLNPAVMADMVTFPNDMTPMQTEVNRLDNQVLVRYYEADWEQVVQ
ncbi:MAG: polyamine aminopropyltransferase [Candidatus Xenobia bacterium]